jgi:hypothetical protein
MQTAAVKKKRKKTKRQRIVQPKGRLICIPEEDGPERTRESEEEYRHDRTCEAR